MRKYEFYLREVDEEYGYTRYYGHLCQENGLADGSVSFYSEKAVDEFKAYCEAANDALDEIEALVKYNEENNLYATKTYRDMVDILVRAGRR